MLDPIFRKVNRFASAKSAAVLLLVTLIQMAVINTVNMPVSAPRINQVSNGAGILDMKLYYTSSEAYRVLDSLQSAGREVYLKFILMIDFIFPFLYSVSLSFVSIVIMRRAFPKASRLWKLSLIPFLAGMFDWLENISIIPMLVRYPKFTDTAYIAGFFTLGKWLLTLVSLLSLLLIVTGILFNIFSRRTVK